MFPTRVAEDIINFAEILLKMIFPGASIRMGAYQGVRNVCFLENLAGFVFLF